MKNFLWLLVFTASAVNAASCEGNFTTISAIQGSGNKSPITGQEITVHAQVTGLFTATGGLGGFFIQSIQPDDNPVTSEGLFIHTGDWQPQLSTGQVITVTGTVSEQHDLTQLTAIKRIELCQDDKLLPEAAAIELPLDSIDLEHFENMRVKLAQPQTITDIYQYVKFGEITVSSERLFSPTTLVAPGIAAAHLEDMQGQDQLVIDDGRLQAYAQPWQVGADSRSPVHVNNPVRLGYSVEAVGILNYVFGRYKLQPTELLKIRPQTNMRAVQPDRPDGNLVLATFNIENWFTDLDDGKGVCGLSKTMGCRGAKNAQDQQRQLAKIVTVINSLNAAVMGLQELQNNSEQSLHSLVSALNEAAGYSKWSYINAGVLGTDIIKVGFIYQPEAVKPEGDYAILDRNTLPEFADHRNRVVLAQTFKHLISNQLFSMATVHLKSKGCRDATGLDADQKDGQGCYNATRKRAAEQISAWLNTDPTGQKASMSLVVGDFNSYQKEDPIVAFEQAGFSNLAKVLLGLENWTTSYRGKVGTLDYILANKAAAQEVTGITQWHINADEIRDFGYESSPLAAGVEKPDNFYQMSPFASSDHDPIIVGLQLVKDP